MDGIIIVDKEKGGSSFSVVNKVSKIFNCKAGHAGTLDPIATGVLPIAIGKATRLLEFIISKNKEYLFTVSWGKHTDTYDEEGEVIKINNNIPKKEDILKILSDFMGTTLQRPPVFSAIKVNGKRAYHYARKGENVDLAERLVTIFNLDLLSHNGNESKFFVKCSKGTYIRSLAVDMAKKLNSCGYISELRRVSVDLFQIKDSILLKDIVKEYENNSINKYIIPMHRMIKNDTYIINFKMFNHIKHGRNIERKDLPFYERSIIKLLFQGKLVAVARYGNGAIVPFKVFI